MWMSVCTNVPNDSLHCYKNMSDAFKSNNFQPLQIKTFKIEMLDFLLFIFLES